MHTTDCGTAEELHCEESTREVNGPERGNESGGEPERWLFRAGKLGPLELPNRILMAPMTRNRAGAGNVPTELMAEYYAQRASAGLIVTEASQISPDGVGYPFTPGIHTAKQVEGWRRVTEKVHAAGGRIFLQLWHVGRISHPSYLGGERPVAPSAVRPAGEAVTPEGPRPFVTPRELTAAEIPGLVERFRQAAANAREAGFDGVEIHAANGYLIDQFLRDGTNRRADAYGGSARNRCRFLLEVVEAVAGVWGPERVGVRLSPLSRFNDMYDSDPETTFTTAAALLSQPGLAYLHVVEQDDFQGRPESFDLTRMRETFRGPYVANGGYDAERAEEVLRSGRADFIAFGRLFLANPDLPERFRRRAALNEPDPSTFYGGDERGYTDYPTLEEQRAAV